ncbi:MAG: response regulator transcription factor [Thermomicrobiales bacterium]
MDVLVVEDDPGVARVLDRALWEAGHRVELAHDGVNGLTRGETGLYDLIVLDVLLPELNGVEVCRQLRQTGIRSAILMLTARDTVLDRVRGLDAGADDYVVKPFAVEELLARIRALDRRVAHPAVDDLLYLGDLALDLGQHEARRGQRTIPLTAKEFALLRYLMRHPGRVLTKEQITDHVWGYDSEATSNVVEIYIHYLRDKIDRGFTRPLIRTVRGAGYMMRE